MKVLSRIQVLSLTLISALGMTVAPVAAYSFQEQKQEVTQSGSSKVTISCEGNGCSSEGTTTYESSASQAQSQHGNSYEYSRHLGKYVMGNENAAYNTKGEVEITWDLRGGSCEVRYTEAKNARYKYFTSTSCDDGGITIGGLHPGMKYRFQVRKEGEGWQSPVTLRAY